MKQFNVIKSELGLEGVFQHVEIDDNLYQMGTNVLSLLKNLTKEDEIVDKESTMVIKGPIDSDTFSLFLNTDNIRIRLDTLETGWRSRDNRYHTLYKNDLGDIFFLSKSASNFTDEDILVEGNKTKLSTYLAKRKTEIKLFSIYSYIDSSAINQFYQYPEKFCFSLSITEYNSLTYKNPFDFRENTIDWNFSGQANIKNYVTKELDAAYRILNTEFFNLGNYSECSVMRESFKDAFLLVYKNIIKYNRHRTSDIDKLDNKILNIVFKELHYPLVSNDYLYSREKELAKQLDMSLFIDEQMEAEKFRKITHTDFYKRISNYFDINYTIKQ